MNSSSNPVFKKTYAHYLSQIKTLPLAAMADRLGARFESEALSIKFFGRRYRVSPESITGDNGEKPDFEICIILSKYLLRCPQTPPRQLEWVSFKDFKDAAPLTNYFANEVEGALAAHYTGRPAALETAAHHLRASQPALDVSYDIALQFDALPKIPLILLFNDADDEFSATCKVLFQRSCNTYLDAECIAMLGWRLHKELRQAIKP